MQIYAPSALFWAAQAVFAFKSHPSGCLEHRPFCSTCAQRLCRCPVPHLRCFNIAWHHLLSFLKPNVAFKKQNDATSHPRAAKQHISAELQEEGQRPGLLKSFLR